MLGLAGEALRAVGEGFFQALEQHCSENLKRGDGDKHVFPLLKDKFPLFDSGGDPGDPNAEASVAPCLASEARNHFRESNNVTSRNLLSCTISRHLPMFEISREIC